VAADGLTVARDPKTGVLREPTPEELAQLTTAAGKSEEKPGNAWRLRDGGVGMRAPAHMTSYSVVRLDSAGGQTFGCVDGEEAAAQWMSGDEVGCDNHAH
jgi:hypothetical protein